jgi:putative (di)nucleoside polyphosphate hydrolase
MKSSRAPRRTSCGVIVTDGERLLLGHATRSPRWDIPKGLIEEGESEAEAAARELQEETGLSVAAAALIPLGTHAYLRDKDLVLFAWFPAQMPDPATLRCASTFALPDGRVLPEIDRFAILAWPEAMQRVGKNLARILSPLSTRIASPHVPL